MERDFISSYFPIVGNVQTKLQTLPHGQGYRLWKSIAAKVTALEPSTEMRGAERSPSPDTCFKVWTK